MLGIIDSLHKNYTKQSGKKILFLPTLFCTNKAIVNGVFFSAINGAPSF